MNLDIKNRMKKFGVYFFRALVLIVAGSLTEIGTSYFSDMINSRLSDFIIVLVMLVIAIVYFVIASQLRPIRSLDNDLGGPAAVLVVLFGSFVDNMTAGWISGKIPFNLGENLASAIMCLLLGILFFAINIFVIDKQYEKFSDDAEEIFCVRVKCDKEDSAYQQAQRAYKAQRAYNLKIAKTWIISIVFVVLAIVAGALWATYGLTWEV